MRITPRKFAIICLMTSLSIMGWTTGVTPVYGGAVLKGTCQYWQQETGKDFGC